MSIIVRCPNPWCRRQHSLNDDQAGKTVKCSLCQQVFKVPSADGHVAQPPRQAAAIKSGVASVSLSAGEPPHSKDPLIGAKIAHYRIQSLLGEGGMGRVYKAHNTSLDKTCAIKILPQEFAKQDQTSIDRFVREARSAAKVEHPNVLPVQFVGKVAENYFIEMQYVDGGTLQGLLKEKGKLEIKEAARIIRDVAAGLQAAHAKGIVHRDMKPTNVMLTRDGRVLVMDFGLAKIAAEGRTALTQQGYILGTPLYMSPEQAMGQAVDARSDIYSLGVMFYQLVTGTPPYTGDSAMAILYQHQHAPIPGVTHVAPETPPHIAEMIRRMMAKNPAERYQSCAEIAQELDGFLTTGVQTVTVSEETLKDAPDHRKSVLTRAKKGAPSRVAPRPPEGTAPKKRTAMPLVLVLVVLVLGAGGYFMTKGKKGSEFRAQGSGTTATSNIQHPTLNIQSPREQQTTAQAAPGAKSAWDDVCVATAATGEKIPHPLSHKTYKQSLPDGTTMDVPEGMVYVPPGEFTMGGKESEHKVWLDGYFIGKYEVTNAEWKVFVDFTACGSPSHWKDGVIPQGRENHPVIYISWEDAQRYCEWVSQMTRRAVRLPTEAQWEKAARGPKGFIYPWGNEWDPRNCNWQGTWLAKCGEKFDPNKGVGHDVWKAFTNSEKWKQVEASGGPTTPVGSHPNDKSFYGCHDMAGNVWEWCADWFKTDYYKLKDAKRNPQGASEEEAEVMGWGGGMKYKRRVLRGGCWHLGSGYCASICRGSGPPSVYTYPYGFRVVILPQPNAGAQHAAALGSRSAVVPPQTGAAASPPVQQPKSAWDEVYVAAAATGEKIPHPLSHKTYKQALPDGTTMDLPEGMVYVPAGEFTMGEGNKPYRGPEHKVSLDGYLIGKYEVTNAEWKVFVDFTGGRCPSPWKNGIIPQGRENHPVTYISWEDARKYCEWVGQMTGRDVRLPTEAQWEKAARGPKSLPYPWGDKWDPDAGNWLRSFLAREGVDKEPKAGGVYDAECRAFLKTPKGMELWDAGGGTMPVGSFPKDRSPYGCYDMAGNCSEWCADWYKADYYLKSPASDPPGPSEEDADTAPNPQTKGKGRVLRGGDWRWSTESGGPKAANRTVGDPTRGSPWSSLRCVILLPAKPAGQKVETGGGTETAAPSPTQPAKSAWDDVHVTAAATGEKILHPLSQKTYTTTQDGQSIEVPEGMVYVPAGDFTMGEGDKPPEGPAHRVYLDAYFIGKYEVTNAEYKAFVDDTWHVPCKLWSDGKIAQGKENHPVAGVSWQDANDYCKWVSRKSGKDVALPTEAQWEKAARGPDGNRLPWGDKTVDDAANWWGAIMTRRKMKSRDYDDALKKWLEFKNSEEGSRLSDAGEFLTPVGAYPAGRSFYGCYDMAGNVREMCADWFRRDYLLHSPRRNPQGPNEAEADPDGGADRQHKGHICRGSGWTTAPFIRRAATSIADGECDSVTGFRIAAGGRGAGQLQGRAQEAKPEGLGARSAWDEVYVATAATGEKIPHPLSRETYLGTLPDGAPLDVPKGMVYVPGGRLMLGDNAIEAARPAHEVDLKPFFMDKYEVTNAQYMEFLKATGRKPPRHIGENEGRIPDGRENHPVSNVSWDDAKAYCDWCGRRLPTEAEWEMAASWDPEKKAKRKYPWGDEPLDRQNPQGNFEVNWASRPAGADWPKWIKELWTTPATREMMKAGGLTKAVGSYARGRSPFMCYDMGGNASEWAADLFALYPGNDNPSEQQSERAKEYIAQKAHVMRGGSWRTGAQACSVRWGEYGFGYVPECSGFRCAADYPWALGQEAGGEERKAESSEKSKSAWDGIYVATAATGEKIPHPFSRKTYTITQDGQTIEVPEGMVYIPPGEFTMGDGDKPPHGPKHKVWLDGYFIGKYEVTCAEWELFTLAEPTAHRSWDQEKGLPEDRKNHPVCGVTWKEAARYCEWVSEQRGRIIRLPTEAQWEKAARGLKGFKYPWGDDWNPILCNWEGQVAARCGVKVNPATGQPDAASWKAFGEGEKWRRLMEAGGGTMPVGSYAGGKSPFGCYDMAGNVCEWCADWYRADYYAAKEAGKNPHGPSSDMADIIPEGQAKGRVVRGAAWLHSYSGNLRTTHRWACTPDTHRLELGFRVVALPSDSKQQTGTAR